jgi:hypothetical protein
LKRGERTGLKTRHHSENGTGLKTRPYKSESKDGEMKLAATKNSRWPGRRLALESKGGGSGGDSTGLKTRHHSENGTGLKTRHYRGFQGADQDVPEVARLIQSIVWEPE